MHAEGYYTFKDEHVLKVLGTLWNRTTENTWYKVAVNYPNDPVRKEIIARVQQYLLERAQAELQLFK
ncbi:hypothetical protein [Chitinophaga sancti]|uniref:Uncharacterized protein n=1 Tax=Chitinophaga sancti TaxID=1004 RepID=A0A1K1SSR2_9BACT|nr:hypothetical protein [Chitinophaga sancti]WQD65413.1 hypothetical protein U0033_13510 [Chitinophaga sancti]WQG88964.1 hypothetical protein SR876_28960 [Chitinophaga sancti]SFW87353.1 hypothetical protein SAMN05661012_06057 [Chitinophaga sancti]